MAIGKNSAVIALHDFAHQVAAYGVVYFFLRCTFPEDSVEIEDLVGFAVVA